MFTRILEVGDSENLFLIPATMFFTFAHMRHIASNLKVPLELHQRRDDMISELDKKIMELPQPSAVHLLTGNDFQNMILEFEKISWIFQELYGPSISFQLLTAVMSERM